MFGPGGYLAFGKYFPDFVVLDDSGVHWIVEGKARWGRDNDQVQVKRKASETLVRRLVVEEEYREQKWGYLIAYEDDIVRSDTWDDLKTVAQPISNAL